MQVPQNPSEFYTQVINKLDPSGVTNFGGCLCSNEQIIAALDETMAAIIKAYLDNKPPKPCQALVGQMLMELVCR